MLEGRSPTDYHFRSGCCAIQSGGCFVGLLCVGAGGGG